ncbi:hypothetical protein PTTG_30368, partial [Puccinia triticina 1-1 BBBD Race 1]
TSENLNGQSPANRTNKIPNLITRGTSRIQAQPRPDQQDHGSDSYFFRFSEPISPGQAQATKIAGKLPLVSRTPISVQTFLSKLVFLVQPRTTPLSPTAQAELNLLSGTNSSVLVIVDRLHAGLPSTVKRTAKLGGTPANAQAYNPLAKVRAH